MLKISKPSIKVILKVNRSCIKVISKADFLNDGRMSFIYYRKFLKKGVVIAR